MPFATCRQCGTQGPWTPTGQMAAEWLMAHNRANHSQMPTGLEFREGRLLHDIHRDYAGHDRFGRLGVGADPAKLNQPVKEE